MLLMVLFPFYKQEQENVSILPKVIALVISEIQDETCVESKSFSSFNSLIFTTTPQSEQLLLSLRKPREAE